MSTLLFWCSLVGVCLSIQIDQSPPAIIKNPGDKVQLVCSHSKTDYTLMHWYQKSLGEQALKRIGHLYYADPSYEELYKQNFTIIGDLRGEKAKNASLLISDLKPEHSAVYYCAASRDSSYSEAYFGAGTKLTVLAPEREVTKPEVKLLQPSPNECRNKKDEAKKKTLVCLAYNFYPDHVTVSWQVNGDNITDGVATDSAANWNKTYYSISSRLRVSADDWHNPKNVFKCIVHFFNGTNTPEYSDEIHGIESSTEGESAEAGIPREEYLKVTQNAKLSFTVLIFKGLVYGVFVAFLICKLQGSSGKQSS